MDPILYQIFNFEHILKKHGENTDNPSVKIYVNKTENRITFIITFIELKMDTVLNF